MKPSHLILLSFLLPLLLSCSALSETWTLEVSEHDPMKTSFTQKWHTTTATVLYYAQSEKWEKALILSYTGDWPEAIKLWMAILEEKPSLERRRNAEYNIAQGCYLLGEWKVADMWMQQCIEDYSSGDVPYYVKRVKSAIDRKL